MPNEPPATAVCLAATEDHLDMSCILNLAKYSTRWLWLTSPVDYSRNYLVLP